MHPVKEIKNKLKDEIPKKELSKIPEGWYRYGDTLIIDLSSIKTDLKERIAKTYMEVLNARTVLDQTRISGEYRKPNIQVICGEKNPQEIHKENDIKYVLDPTQIMFSPSNESERKRMYNLKIKNNEKIVDMFAGIGHLSIPIAKKASETEKQINIHAIEKNPYTYEFLNKTVKENKIQNYNTYNLDCRKFPKRNFADRILMGYVRKTHHFLDKAFDIIKPEGTIHYHETVPEKLKKIRPIKRIKKSATKSGYTVLKIKFNEVKKYSPGVIHVVLDSKVTKNTRKG